MRRLVASCVITLLVSCGMFQKTPPPPPAKVAKVTPRTEPPFVHRVETRDETLGRIARWYTGSYENWKKLARPMNPDLEQCCVPLQIGREVLIPMELVVRKDPIPKQPELATRPAEPLAKSKDERTEPAADQESGEAAAEAPAAEPLAEPPPAVPIAEAPSPPRIATPPARVEPTNGE